MNIMTEQEFLANYDITQYPQPSVATDIVLFTLDKQNDQPTKIQLGPLQILLIQRATHPCKDKWALPGGFCKPDETFEETAIRELFEETNVENAYLEETKTFTGQNRDKRGWIASDAFTGIICKSDCTLRADSDAWKAEWFDVSLQTVKSYTTTTAKTTFISNTTTTATTVTTYKLICRNKNEWLHALIRCTKTLQNGRLKYQWEVQHSDFAFDHAQIITELLLHLRKTIQNDPRMLFEFVPEFFTIGELEAAYKAIYELTDRIPNFRRKINDYVIETPNIADKQAFRPAKLYIRNVNMF